MERRTATAVALAGAGAVAAAVYAARRRSHAPLTTFDGGQRTKVETADGAVLEVDIAGDGPTVVLVHGWTNTLNVWDPVAAGLVDRGYRVVRYSQRGHGSSTCGTAPVDIALLGTDLRDVLETLDVRDAVLAGHSMGGMAAMAFAIEYPDVVAARVRELVLVATAADGLSLGGFGRVAPLLVDSAAIERVLASKQGHRFLRGVLGKDASPAAVAATADFFVTTPGEVRSSHLRAIMAMDQLAGCSSITVPTTVVIGTRDGLTPPALGRRVHAAIAGSRLVEVKGAGHMLPYEATGLLVDLIGGTR